MICIKQDETEKIKSEYLIAGPCAVRWSLKNNTEKASATSEMDI